MPRSFAIVSGLLVLQVLAQLPQAAGFHFGIVIGRQQPEKTANGEDSHFPPLPEDTDLPECTDLTPISCYVFQDGTDPLGVGICQGIGLFFCQKTCGVCELYERAVSDQSSTTPEPSTTTATSTTVLPTNETLAGSTTSTAGPTTTATPATTTTITTTTELITPSTEAPIQNTTGSTSTTTTGSTTSTTAAEPTTTATCTEAPSCAEDPEICFDSKQQKLCPLTCEVGCGATSTPSTTTTSGFARVPLRRGRRRQH